MLSGEVENVTVALRVPPAAASVDKVIRQLTQGVTPERFATEIVEFPVNGKVKEQSCVCAVSGRHTRRAAPTSRRGMALRKVVMPHILRLLRLGGEGVHCWHSFRSLPKA